MAKKSVSNFLAGREKYVIFITLVLIIGGLVGYSVGLQQTPTVVVVTQTTTAVATTTTATVQPGEIELVSSCAGADFSLTGVNECKVNPDNTNIVSIEVRNVGTVDLTEKHFKIFVDGVYATDFYSSSQGLNIPAGGSIGTLGKLMIVSSSQKCTTYGVANSCNYGVSVPCADITKPTSVVCSGN